MRTSLIVLAYFAFISLGLPDGLLGVGWPFMAATFDVPTASVGCLLVAATTGYLASSVAAGFLLSRVGVGWLLAASTAATSLALAGYALAPGLWFLVPCALLGGFGGGAIDAGLNAYAAANFNARHMNWMHACFGLGVAVGPLIMTSVLSGGSPWRLGYAVVAAAQLCLAVSFAGKARSWGRAPVPVHETPQRGRDTLRLPVVWLGVAAFGVYVAVEAGAGLWAFLLLTEGRGSSDAVAGVCVSGYWAMLFLGRVVQGAVADRVGVSRVIAGCLAGMAAGAFLVALPGPGWLAAAGLGLLGFAAAPVFPLLTLTTADRVGAAHADRAIGLQTAVAGLGGALVPTAIGVLLARAGVNILGSTLFALALLLLLLYRVSLRLAAVPAGAGRPDGAVAAAGWSVAAGVTVDGVATGPPDSSGAAARPAGPPAGISDRIGPVPGREVPVADPGDGAGSTP
ncbi:MFS transporter [Dactylosporangium aurantiacum]|uniref:MFS transporter n=1 Tax=Dactylosporangium aurantiacum TaxID=35754 RepID=UPI0007C55C7E|nr:MFS transporter [Dactylosporangium aurantiacum]MDG6104045.1 MFS transporter [Dactylosporangium aurantiacum]